MRLYWWSFEKRFDSWYLQGVVEGHNKYADGTIVITTPIKSIICSDDDKVLTVITKSGSHYTLPCEEMRNVVSLKQFCDESKMQMLWDVITDALSKDEKSVKKMLCERNSLYIRTVSATACRACFKGKNGRYSWVIFFPESKPERKVHIAIDKVFDLDIMLGHKTWGIENISGVSSVIIDNRGEAFTICRDVELPLEVPKNAIQTMTICE